MASEVSKPHDRLFRAVFREETEATGLLRAYLPEAVSRELLWSSIEFDAVSFIDDRLRESESDLLYAIRRQAGGAPAWLYVLLEHQSTPDAWLRLRLLKYRIRIWERDRRRHPKEEQLRLIVPLVLYQGERGWRIACEFSELFAAEVRGWPGVPRYAHLLVDQTEVGPDEVRGELRGRIAQLAMMAAYRTSWPLLQRLVPLRRKRRLAAGRGVHCGDDAGVGALASIRRRGTATGARRCTTDEQDPGDAGDLVGARDLVVETG